MLLNWVKSTTLMFNRFDKILMIIEAECVRHSSKLWQALGSSCSKESILYRSTKAMVVYRREKEYETSLWNCMFLNVYSMDYGPGPTASYTASKQAWHHVPSLKMEKS